MARRRRSRKAKAPRSSPSIDLGVAIPYICSKAATELNGYRTRCAARLSELGSAPDDSKDVIKAAPAHITFNESGLWYFINKANSTQVETLQVLHAVLTRQMKFSGLL